MKKVLALVLIFTVFASLIACPVGAKYDESYLYDNDFESGDSTGWTFNRAAIRNGTIVIAENAKGFSQAKAELRLGTMSDNNMKFDISFDVKPGEVTTFVQANGAKSAVIPVSFAKNGEIVINAYRPNEEKARTYIKYSTDTWYRVHTVIDQTGEAIRTSVYDKNSGELVAEKLVNNYKPYTSWDMMSGGLNTLTFQTEDIGSNNDYLPTYIDNLSITHIPISYKLYTQKFGNNFGRTDKEEIYFNVVNDADCGYDCEIEWYIEENDLGRVKQGVEQFKIDALSETEVVVAADLKRYGLYKMTAILSWYEDGKKVKIDDKRDIYFSKLMSSDGETYSSRIGICSHMSDFLDEQIELMEMLGCAGTRCDVTWQTVQSADGTFNYAYRPEQIDAFANSKMPSNLFILTYGHPSLIEQVDYLGNPANATDRRPPRNQKELELFGNYIDYVMDRLGNGIEYYEVWNEFSGIQESKVYGGACLAEICKEAKKRIKKRNPNAKVIGLGGVMLTDTDFVKEFFEAGGHEYCDAFSIHPYWAANSGVYPSELWMSMLKDVVDIIRQYEPTKPIYLTEVGWSSVFEGNDEYIKGRNIVISSVVTLAHGLGDMINVYDLQCDGLNPNDREHNFGILTANGDYRGGNAALPGCLIMAAANKLMPGQIICEGMIEKNARKTCAYNIKREDGKNVAVMWSKERNTDLSLDLGCTSVEAYDEYGNLIETIYSETGVYDFGLSDKLMYVLGDFERFEETQTVISHKDAEYSTTVNDVMRVSVSDSMKRNGKLEIEYNSKVMELLNEGIMQSGETQAEFRTQSNYLGQYPLNLKLYDENGKCIYVSQNIAEIRDPVSVEVKAVNYFKNDSRWGIEVTIHNNANASDVIGKAKITQPYDIAEKCETVSFVPIAPKQSEKIYINLPEMLKKRTVTVKGEVELDYGFVTDFSQYMDFTSAFYTNNPPKIDGRIDEGEWRGGVMAATSKENWTSLISSYPWNGPDDCSLDILKIMWDEEKLYLAAKVRDDRHINVEEKADFNAGTSTDKKFYLWQYDSLQFGIEDEYFNVANRLSYPFTEVGIALGDNGPYAYRFSSQVGLPTGELQNCSVAITVSGSETVYECAIPWSEIHGEGYKPDDSLIYAFSALINDNDGLGRKGFIMYNDGIGKTKSINLFGQMRLKK